MHRKTLAVVAPLATVTACIPYTVGSTAVPLPAGAHSTTMSTFVMPSVGGLDSTRASLTQLAVDFERRWGIDGRADVGLRATSGSGLVLNYKRLLTGPHSRANIAIMPGAGFVNMGQHAHFELTLLASGTEVVTGTRSDTTMRPGIVPFGGFRVMQVAPLAEGAVHDKPTIGGFVGARIGSRDFGISPEVGVFYDHSALGVRRGDLVIVPAISVHGDRLIDMIGDMLGRGGIFALGRPRRAAPADEPRGVGAGGPGGPPAGAPATVQRPGVVQPSDAKLPATGGVQRPGRVRGGRERGGGERVRPQQSRVPPRG